MTPDQINKIEAAHIGRDLRCESEEHPGWIFAHPCEQALLVAHCRALESRLERVEKAARGLLDVAAHERLCEVLVGGQCNCVLPDRAGAWMMASMAHPYRAESKGT